MSVVPQAQSLLTPESSSAPAAGGSVSVSAPGSRPVRSSTIWSEDNIIHEILGGANEHNEPSASPSVAPAQSPFGTTTATNTATPSNRVKVTGYRLLVTAITLGLGVAKYALTQEGQSTIPNALDFLLGTIVAVILYWIGCFEAVEPPLLLWFFHVDYSPKIGEACIIAFEVWCRVKIVVYPGYFIALLVLTILTYLHVIALWIYLLAFFPALICHPMYKYWTGCVTFFERFRALLGPAYWLLLCTLCWLLM